ncbi:TPA: DUF3509 domain-containing protein, partial [Pseudomonas aeruginosa]|nr:DUF3509 domain-containing protein [Pseudomonas aeruginosa]HBO8014636.1 DUF3509 domain-containing protein [Pseudomonas aeruginosa]
MHRRTLFAFFRSLTSLIRRNRRPDLDSLKQRLADAFAPHPFTLSQPRPDGGRVVTLVDPQGETLLQRVIAKV